jgi:hypothetical protein
VRSIYYNGDHATFSPDGTRVASIYGKFLKIWKTNSGYNHREASINVHDTIDDIYVSPDEWLIILKSKEGADILDVTTGQSLFTSPVANPLSIAFSLDSALVAFLSPHGTVHTWNAHTRLQNFILVTYGISHIALSPDCSQLASISLLDMKLWNLERQGCLAHLQFDKPLQVGAQISFSINGTSVFLKNGGGTQNWRISPNHNIDTRDSIQNSGSTQRSRDRTKLPMVFVPTTEEQSNQDVCMPCQSYSCDTDGEWILDQDERRVLWIPPDERPRKIWNSIEKVMVIQTESGKVYFVNFAQ